MKHGNDYSLQYCNIAIYYTTSFSLEAQLADFVHNAVLSYNQIGVIMIMM